MKNNGYEITDVQYGITFKNAAKTPFAGYSWLEIRCYFSEAGLCEIVFVNHEPLSNENVNSIANYLKSEDYEEINVYKNEDPYATWIKGDCEVKLQNGIRQSDNYSDNPIPYYTLDFYNRKIAKNK